MGPNRQKNMALKSREWYYIVSMYKYNQLALFVVLNGKFNQKSNSQPNWPELGVIRAELGITWGKHDFQKMRAVLQVYMYNYYKLTLFQVLNEKFDQKSNFHPGLA